MAKKLYLDYFVYQYFYNIIASDALAHEYKLTSTGGNNSEVSEVEALTAGKIRIETSADGINILNAEGLEITICTVEGTILHQSVASSEFENRRVAPGIYVVSAGCKVEKVMVK